MKKGPRGPLATEISDAGRAVNIGNGGNVKNNTMKSMT
jgi:hypothetical protein